MIYKNEKRRFYVHPGINCTCVLPIPDLAADPGQAQAMGNSVSEKKDRIDQFLSEIFFPQFVMAIKRFVIAYSVSDLPKKYLAGHNVYVISLPLEERQIAWYSPASDCITIDADTLNLGRRGVSGEFIYGHVFGHRIMHFSSRSALKSALEDVANIIGFSDADVCRTILADAFASLITPAENSSFSASYEPIEQEGLQRVALKLAWSV